MRSDRTVLHYLHRSRKAATLASALIAGFTSHSAEAARPMETDDAFIVDSNACQLESWVRNNRGSTEYWALPACNFGSSVELTLGGAMTRTHGHSRITDILAQGKTVIKPVDADGWGLGLTIGTVHNPHAKRRKYDWNFNLPASFSFRNDALFMHTNLGWERVGETKRDRLTWGLASEIQLTSHA